MKHLLRLTALVLAAISPFHSYGAALNREAMKQMPILKSKRTYVVKGDEDFEGIRGYGEESPQVDMMNLMMVEGSGMEGMDMGEMQMGRAKSGTEKMEGMKMDGMKMADAQTPSVNQSQATHDMKSKAAPALGKEGSDAASETADSQLYKVEVSLSPSPARVGTNDLEFTVSDSKTGKATTGLKIEAQISMTSMDMGTQQVKAKEIKPGRYKLKVGFGMKGPWAVELKGSKGFKKRLEFEAGG